MTQDYYQKGERLRVTIEGDAIKVGNNGGDTLVTLAYLLPEGATAHAGLFTDSPAVRVERLIPAEGEPQIGDVWRDRDDVNWFAYNGAYETRINLMSARGEVDDWGFINRERGPLSRIYRVPVKPVEQVPTRPQIAGTPGEGTVPIGGVSPKSFVVHPDWNDGKPVGISTVEDSETYPGMTFVAYTDVRRPGSAAVMVDVDPELQVTPWNFGDAL